MTIQEELHRLVDALDGNAARQQLHALINLLNKDQSDAALSRMRNTDRHWLKRMGFAL